MNILTVFQNNYVKSINLRLTPASSIHAGGRSNKLIHVGVDYNRSDHNFYTSKTNNVIYA